LENPLGRFGSDTRTPIRLSKELGGLCNPNDVTDGGKLEKPDDVAFTQADATIYAMTAD